MSKQIMLVVVTVIVFIFAGSMLSYNFGYREGKDQGWNDGQRSGYYSGYSDGRWSKLDFIEVKTEEVYRRFGDDDVGDVSYTYLYSDNLNNVIQRYGNFKIKVNIDDAKIFIDLSEKRIFETKVAERR